MIDKQVVFSEKEKRSFFNKTCYFANFTNELKKKTFVQIVCVLWMEFEFTKLPLFGRKLLDAILCWIEISFPYLKENKNKLVVFVLIFKKFRFVKSCGHLSKEFETASIPETTLISVDRTFSELSFRALNMYLAFETKNWLIKW